MSLSKWKKLGLSTLHRNSWWEYRKDDFELPGGKKGEYHYVHTNGSSLVVPVMNDGKIVLVNQYRYLRDAESLELPCGGVKNGATHDQTAVDELAEEAGYTAREWSVVGEFNPYNGVTDELCRVYVARNLSSILSTPDVTEEFEKHFLAPVEVEARIVSGVIWDGMTIAAWTIAKNHL